MKLTSDARSELQSSAFALPSKRAFPIEDKPHAQKALQLVGRSVAAGNTTPAEAALVKTKAKAKLAGAKPAAAPVSAPKAMRNPKALHGALAAIRNH